MTLRNTFLLLFSSSALLHQFAGACYWRNGTENKDPNYAPCSSDTANPLHTICCARWDNCLPNGLCESQLDGVIWRETCTKRDWDEGGCQELCSNERKTQMSNNEIVTPCEGTTSSETWCCGANTTDCCTAGNNIPVYTIAKRFGDPIPTATTSAVPSGIRSSVSNSISSSPTAVAPTSAGITTSNSTLSTGAKAGIAVGATLGSLTLVLLGFFIAKAMQRRERIKASQAAGTMPLIVGLNEYKAGREYGSRGTWEHQSKWAQLPAAGGEHDIHELYTSKEPAEMGVATPTKPVP